MVLSLYILLRSFSHYAYFYAALTLPGTAAHEISHLLVGIFLRAKPVGFSLVPHRKPGSTSFVLGQVAFANLNWWKKLPVATAPLLILFPLGCWFVLDSLSAPRSQEMNFLSCYAALQCFTGCWPSSTDWALARTTIYVLLGVFALVVLSYFVFH